MTKLISHFLGKGNTNYFEGRHHMAVPATITKQKAAMAPQKAEASQRHSLTWQRSKKENDGESLAGLLTDVGVKQHSLM
jgi:hypothetical protein